MKFQSNMNRHMGKLANILHLPSNRNRKLEQKLLRNPRSYQTSITCLYRQSLSLMKREKEVRMMRMKIDKIRRRAERVVNHYSGTKAVTEQEPDENIVVVDGELSEIFVTQDDVEGEEQLERLENAPSLESGVGSCEKSLVGLKTSEDPIDLSYSSFTNHMKLCIVPPKYRGDSPGQLSRDNPRPPIQSVASVTSINNLPSRRSADDHLEQFMMVDPNQNIKWKQLADKFNKELGPNVCGVCHKTLSCKSALTMHYRVHTEERPFVCKICEKRFSTKGNLKTHLGQHADVTDQYCLSSSMSIGPMKSGTLIPPSSSLPSPTAMNQHSQRVSLHHPGFPFSFPGLAANPNFLLNMFGHSNAEFNMLDALKASQKLAVGDINSNFIVKPGEGGTSNGCHICRQNFPSKEALEVHVRSHGCKKEFPGVAPGEQFIFNLKSRIQSGQFQKPDGDRDSNGNPGDGELHHEPKNNSEKFSLTNIMGLPNHPASLLSLMNNPSMVNRSMLPPIPGFVPQLCGTSHPWVHRMTMSTGGPINNFCYNYSDIDNK